MAEDVVGADVGADDGAEGVGGWVVGWRLVWGFGNGGVGGGGGGIDVGVDVCDADGGDKRQSMETYIYQNHLIERHYMRLFAFRQQDGFWKGRSHDNISSDTKLLK